MARWELLEARGQREVSPTLAAMKLRQGWGTQICGGLDVSRDEELAGVRL